MPGFDPNEPRDELGRWTDSLSTATQNAASDRPFKNLPSYTPNEKLSEDEKAVQDKFAKELNDNFPQKVQEYLNRFGNELNPDNVKKLSADFEKDPAKFGSAVHEPASAFTKAIYKELLARPAVFGSVVFTAGGAGAGKSSGLKASPELTAMKAQSDIVYDSVLQNYDKAKVLIDQAVKSGRKVTVIFTHRDMVDAFENGVVPRMKGPEGRPVSIATVLDQYTKIAPNIEKLRNAYNHAGSRVAFYAVDNSRGLNNARVEPFESVIKKSYISGTEAKSGERKMRDFAHDEYLNGYITKDQYKALTENVH